jgi:hypothetical protein
MIGLLLLLVLLVLVFGGLGIFVAKVFFIGLIAMLVLSFFAGGGLMRRSSK